MPCQEILDKENKDYQEKIKETKSCSRISIEAGSIKGWAKYINSNGFSIGLDDFGKSAPYKEIYNHFDLNSDKVVEIARGLLKK